MDELTILLSDVQIFSFRMKDNMEYFLTKALNDFSGVLREYNLHGGTGKLSINCQARFLVLVIVLDYSLRLVSIPASKGPERKLTGVYFFEKSLSFQVPFYTLFSKVNPAIKLCNNM